MLPSSKPPKPRRVPCGAHVGSNPITSPCGENTSVEALPSSRRLGSVPSRSDNSFKRSRLTRSPIDYYLQRGQTTSKLFETSFPAEIDEHPGYEGRIDDTARKADLGSEAEDLVDKIAKMQSPSRGLRIFFFHGFRPQIDSILEERLRERFRIASRPGCAMCRGFSLFQRSVCLSMNRNRRCVQRRCTLQAAI